MIGDLLARVMKPNAKAIARFMSVMGEGDTIVRNTDLVEALVAEGNDPIALATNLAELRGIMICDAAPRPPARSARLRPSPVGDLLGRPFEVGLAPAAALEGVTHLPEPVSPVCRSRTPDLGRIYRSQCGKHLPGPRRDRTADLAAFSQLWYSGPAVAEEKSLQIGIITS
jgi:hypothetical protein